MAAVPIVNQPHRAFDVANQNHDVMVARRRHARGRRCAGEPVQPVSRQVQVCNDLAE